MSSFYNIDEQGLQSTLSSLRNSLLCFWVIVESLEVLGSSSAIPGFSPSAPSDFEIHLICAWVFASTRRACLQGMAYLAAGNRAPCFE